jgi:hypothetical protein
MGSSCNITGGALAANIAWWLVLTGREASIIRRRRKRTITVKMRLQIIDPGALGLFQRERRAWWRNVLSVFTVSTRG